MEIVHNENVGGLQILIVYRVGLQIQHNGGGVSNSYHLFGLAADIGTITTLKRSSKVNNMWLFKLIKQNMKALGVDEVIAEKSSLNGCQWVHVQIPKSGVNPRYKAIYA